MALIHVRANEGDKHFTHVDEAWLKRWPDDYTPVTDDKTSGTVSTETGRDDEPVSRYGNYPR